MAKTINGINFTNLSKSGIGSAIANTIKPGITDESGLQEFINAGAEYRNIQSVLIDWNGADFAGMTVPASAPSTINTTGDLLKTIKYAANGEILGKLMFAESLREPHSSQRLAKRYMR